MSLMLESVCIYYFIIVKHKHNKSETHLILITYHSLIFFRLLLVVLHQSSQIDVFLHLLLSHFLQPSIGFPQLPLQMTNSVGLLLASGLDFPQPIRQLTIFFLKADNDFIGIYWLLTFDFWIFWGLVIHLHFQWSATIFLMGFIVLV